MPKEWTPKGTLDQSVYSLLFRRLTKNFVLFRFARSASTGMVFWWTGMESYVLNSSGINFKTETLVTATHAHKIHSQQWSVLWQIDKYSGRHLTCYLNRIKQCSLCYKAQLYALQSDKNRKSSPEYTLWHCRQSFLSISCGASIYGRFF